MCAKHCYYCNYCLATANVNYLSAVSDVLNSQKFMIKYQQLLWKQFDISKQIAHLIKLYICWEERVMFSNLHGLFVCVLLLYSGIVRQVRMK